MPKLQHLVSYKTNSGNLEASDLIITYAKKYLAPLVENFTIGKTDSRIQRC